MTQRQANASTAVGEVLRRSFSAQRMTLLRSSAAPAAPGVMRGHGAVFNQKVELWPGYFELIEPGAFTEAIVADDVRCLVNHNTDMVLGRNKAGTLRLSEDDIGLHVDCDLPDTTAGRDMAVSLERGDISQMSFGFGIEDARTETSGGDIVRIITKIRPLVDVSPVAFPAYTGTDAQIYARALGSLGVRGNDVIRALFRAEYRAELSASDLATIQGAIQALAALLSAGEEEEENSETIPPTAEPAITPGSVSSARSSLATLEQRLRQVLAA